MWIPASEYPLSIELLNRGRRAVRIWEMARVKIILAYSLPTWRFLVTVRST
jgi:hypothetical protein